MFNVQKFETDMTGTTKTGEIRSTFREITRLFGAPHFVKYCSAIWNLQFGRFRVGLDENPENPYLFRVYTDRREASDEILRAALACEQCCDEPDYEMYQCEGCGAYYGYCSACGEKFDKHSHYDHCPGEPREVAL
jgi:hypothetical protein